MFLSIWISTLCTFIIVMSLFQIYYNYRNKKRLVEDRILEENLKTADEYEIAFLKGGDKLAYELAFYHLLKGGYLEKTVIGPHLHTPSHLYEPAPSKDKSKLHQVENEVLSKFESTSAWPKVLKDLYEESNSVNGYRDKAFKLNLFYRRGWGFRLLRIVFNMCVIISSIFAWGNFSLILPLNKNINLYSLLGLISLVLIDIFSYRIVDRKILDRPISIVRGMARSGTPLIREYCLTEQGIKYVNLFESKKFPLPNLHSDYTIEEAYQVHRCSI